MLNLVTVLKHRLVVIVGSTGQYYLDLLPSYCLFYYETLKEFLQPVSCIPVSCLMIHALDFRMLHTGIT